jgi:glutamate/tyrosine decarboxylase-like PLP-dependent enzyme
MGRQLGGIVGCTAGPRACGRAAARHRRPGAALPFDEALDDRPAIVCAQVGNVNTGAVDAVGQVSDIAHRNGAWVHVDGAFGL